ncbi:MAG: hypothetical protein MI892_21325 [Desulfobacterales bacterium]|nr:hypothetical protein [Desulfobacterales bacterium]
MKRFGNTKTGYVGQKKHHNLFRMRLHLMIIMVKAKLEGYPVGSYRKQAVLNIASELHKDVSQMDIRISRSNTSNHLFKERVKLLSVMATAMISEDYPLGIHRREAVLNNIDSIIATAFPSQDFSAYHKILKAA